MTKLEVSLDIIVHATEDLGKFFKSFEEMFGLKEDDFIISNVEGHFENPITLLRAKFTKKPACLPSGYPSSTLYEREIGIENRIE